MIILFLHFTITYQMESVFVIDLLKENKDSKEITSVGSLHQIKE